MPGKLKLIFCFGLLNGCEQQKLKIFFNFFLRGCTHGALWELADGLLTWNLHKDLSEFFEPLISHNFLFLIVKGSLSLHSKRKKKKKKISIFCILKWWKQHHLRVLLMIPGIYFSFNFVTSKKLTKKSSQYFLQI